VPHVLKQHPLPVPEFHTNTSATLSAQR
jgi:hypothetical protein